MGTKLLRWSSVGALALALFAGCGDSKEWKDVKKEAGETWDAAKAWGAARRVEAERVYASSVASLSRTYETSRAKAQVAGGDAAKNLDAKWNEVQLKLTELKATTADKWEHARDGFVKAYEAFKAEVAKP